MQSHAAWKRLIETFFLSPVVGCKPASKTVPTPKAVARQRRCQRFHAGGGAGGVGSWWFIGTQSAILLGWAWLNFTAWVQHWDPYPFILMNLFLSLQAAYTAPMLMMSQNRLAARDRLEAHNEWRRFHNLRGWPVVRRRNGL